MAVVMKLGALLITLSISAWLEYRAGKIELRKPKRRNEKQDVQRSLNCIKILKIFLPALFLFVSTDVVDMYSKWSSDPKVDVLIKTTESNIELNITKRKVSIESFGIDIPIWGEVENISEWSSESFRSNVNKTVSSTVQRDTTLARLNRASININKIGKTDYLTYIIKYKKFSIPLHLEFDYLDRSCYRYTWLHKGEILEEQGCVSLKEEGEKVLPAPPLAYFYIDSKDPRIGKNPAEVIARTIP